MRGRIVIGKESFRVETESETFVSQSLVVATGGLSIPPLGATDFGYRLARQFGLKIQEPRPALVPFTLSRQTQRELSTLSGVSIDASVSCQGQAVSRKHSHHASRAEWTGDPANLFLLVAGIARNYQSSAGSQRTRTLARTGKQRDGVGQLFSASFFRAALPTRGALLTFRHSHSNVTHPASLPTLPKNSITGTSFHPEPKVIKRRKLLREVSRPGALFANDGSPKRSGPLFHRRGRGCYGPARRL